MKHTMNHSLGREKAVSAAEEAFSHYRNRLSRYNPTATWSTPNRAEITFVVKGITFRGSLTIFDDKIEMELDVPFVFRPFTGMALKVVETEAARWLSKRG